MTQYEALAIAYHAEECAKCIQEMALKSPVIFANHAQLTEWFKAILKHEAAAPEAPAVDVEALKKSTKSEDHYNEASRGAAKGWNECLRHLAASGYLRTPPVALDLAALERAREEFYDGDGSTSEETNEIILVLLDNAIAVQKGRE